MNKKMSKRQKDIKSKLMAAICMLLVSSIMMVSSTYAWFTLSTAPEVTGIQTAVGANGNLEMALLPTSGAVADIKSAVGDSYDATSDYTKTNITWGNLVNLKDAYGLEKITLFPAQLNAATKDAAGNPLTLAEALLETPVYGSDGRVSDLMANTVTSTYAEDTFPQNDLYGVRAVGVASGMTDRQLAYRNARSTATTAMAQAKNAAATSLTNNGNALANIAIAHGTNKSATHTQDDVAALLKIVDDLLGASTVTNTDGTIAVTYSSDVDGAIEYIEEAYIQYILAYGASNEAITNGLDDGKFLVFKGLIDGAESLDEAIKALTDQGVTLPSAAADPIAKLKLTKQNVMDAKVALEELKATGGEVTWAQLSPSLYKLAYTDAMEINGIPAGEIMDRVNELVQTISGGLTVSMGTGGGVYADIADHCGDYNASIVIKEIKYGTLEVTDMPARMATESTVSPSYLDTMYAKVQDAKAPESGEGTVMPITDMYGYIIDLAFKTNAAESTLLLQQDGVDRIYDENGNEDTLGHGSTMTFKSTTTDFTDDKVKELMGAIRIVFFQKDGGNVVATAKLDVAGATAGADGITAKMYLYEVTAGGEEVYEKVTEFKADSTDAYYTASESKKTVYEETTVTQENFATTTNLYTKAADANTYTKVDTTTATYDANTQYYAAVEKTVTNYTEYDKTLGEPAEGTTLYYKTTTAAGENKLTDNEIIALTQNQATQLSVLVYLDGNNVQNEDVAATAPTSVTGTMNLQFASSATLVPMEYADLHLPVTETQAPAAGGEGAGG